MSENLLSTGLCVVMVSAWAAFRFWRGLKMLKLLLLYRQLDGIIDEHARAICVRLDIEDDFRAVRTAIWNRLI
jgi:hypothetical protein